MKTMTARTPRAREASPMPVERIVHRHVRYEIYEDPTGDTRCWLVGFRHGRAYLIDHGPRRRLHDTATHQISFGGYLLIERSRAPATLKAALSPVAS